MLASTQIDLLSLTSNFLFIGAGKKSHKTAITFDRSNIF